MANSYDYAVYRSRMVLLNGLSTNIFKNLLAFLVILGTFLLAVCESKMVLLNGLSKNTNSSFFPCCQFCVLNVVVSLDVAVVITLRQRCIMMCYYLPIHFDY